MTEQLNWIWLLLYLSIMLDAICYVTDYLEDTLCFLKPNFTFLQVITFLYTMIVKGLWFLLQVELCFSSNWSVGVLINTCCWSVAQLYLTLWLHGLQYIRHPSPSLCPGVCSNSCPLSQWCDPGTSPSVTPFSSCPQFFLTSVSFPVSQLFTSGG